MPCFIERNKPIMMPMKMILPTYYRVFWLSMAAVLLISSVVYSAASDTLQHVDAQQAKKILDKDTTVVVLDVRTPEEFKSQTGYLPRALNIPVQELEARLKELDKYRSRQLLVYCRSGNRSMRASEILQKQGFKLIHLDGGILQWNAAFPPPIKEEEKK
jgi:rhodanese-related sulfurtransferase